MTPLETLCLNTIRMLSADAVQKARSGHPGMPMGAAALGYVLFTRFLKHNPRNPAWIDRDRFILSAGHGSMLLYSLLHLTGYDLSLEELQNFRQWGARTAGHPEYGMAPGIEVTTGPLGQGLAHGVGIAMAERYLATRFNRPGHEIVDHYTYGIVGDGDLMEGISHEAASLAGHLKLGKLIYLFDDNGITIEGQTSLATSDDTVSRFRAYGWEVHQVDGNDLEALEAAVDAARGNSDQPSLIAARTHIGHGSPNKQDSAAVHGAPLGVEELKLTKEALGWPLEPPFHIPAEVRTHLRKALARGEELEAAWEQKLAAYEEAFPAEHLVFNQWQAGALPSGWQEALWSAHDGTRAAPTRSVSGQAIQALAPLMENLVGGSADLGPSNNTTIKDRGGFEPGTVSGPNIHFGVREHAMGAILGGLALHGGLRPFGGTFLVFSDYMRPAIRLAAMMQLPVLYIFTHDSIGLGEDGPTHQPVEHLPALRAIPGLTVIRPADATETLAAWAVALERPGPVALVLSRQKLPALSGAQRAEVARGAYVLAEKSDKNPDLILIASGSEVQPALGARDLLAAEGLAVRIVSMPSWELFEEQPEDYRVEILPAGTPKFAIEAAAPLGWERYVTSPQAVLGMARFGASAPAEVLFERFGFTAEHIATRAKACLVKTRS